MQAVILAAGRGTRMGAVTDSTPKPLLLIDKSPILTRTFAVLPHEIDEVIIVVGYLGEKIRELFGYEYAGRKVRYVEQAQLLGTAHALYQCKELLRGRFLVLMGDDLYRKEDLARLISKPLGILVWRLSNAQPGDFQALVSLNSHGQLADIIERQPAVAGGLVNCGAYALDERIFDFPMAKAGNQTAEFGLPQTLLQLVRQGIPLDIVEATWWHKVTTPEDLKNYFEQ